MTNRLVVDIGNSRISCAMVLDGELVDLSHHLLTDIETAEHDIARDADAMKVSQIALCSVVPSKTHSLLSALKDHHNVFEVSKQSQTLISGTYESLGADRIAVIAAALKLYAKESPAIVIDFGTATTLTAVSMSGEFLGGLITLGLGNTVKSLHQSTEQLPDVGSELNTSSPSPLQFDTARSIVSGCILGHVGLVEHWVNRAKQELGANSVVVATGGHVHTIAALAKCFDHIEPNLILYGIDFIAEAAMARVDQP